MALAIAFYWDRSTKENSEISDNLVQTLAAAGIAYEYHENNFVEKLAQNTPLLIVDGVIYNPKFIQEHQIDVLKHLKQVDKERRKRESQLAKAVS